MIFEFVEFYETTEEKKKNSRNRCIGTVHIYIADFEMDIRGIRVIKNGNCIFFACPHFFDIDKETGEKVRYPLIGFTNEKKQKELLDFLHTVVKKRILESKSK